MGGVPKKHHSKSKVGRRRSQQALVRKRILACPKCSGPTMPHRICSQCGFYGSNKKKETSQVAKQVEQKEVKQEKEPEKAVEKEVPETEDKTEEEEEVKETTEETKKEKSEEH